MVRTVSASSGTISSFFSTNEIRHYKIAAYTSPKVEYLQQDRYASNLEQTARLPLAVMGGTMQGELDKEVSKVDAGTEFTKFKEEKQAKFDIQSREFEQYTRELRTEAEQRLREAEERLSRDIRTKVFSLSLAIVMSAVGAMLISSFAATRDVNNSVIALQKDIIAAQTALTTASDALVEQRQKLANAEADLILATSKSTDARSKLEATTQLLVRARGDYEGVTKPTTDARSKLEATAPQLDKARGEYEKL